jgi:hypothetical protein
MRGFVHSVPVSWPRWTDFNESDPGTPLLQLFAFLADGLTYRRNRIAVGVLVGAAFVWFRRRDGNDDD